ncbi:MAG: hypothetical protein AAB263_20525 [Planctomycetota bacterium]
MAKTEQLYAGFAKQDMTPDHPRGMSLMGMGRVYPGAAGVLDRLFVRASYIGTKSQGVLLVVLDTVFPNVLAPHQDEVIGKLAAITGLPPKRIWIVCTHCHSAVGEGFDLKWEGGDHYRLRTFSKYMDVFLAKVVATGAEAYSKRQAVEIGYASAPVAQVTSNRRVKSGAGIVITGWANGPTPPPGMRIVGRGPHDPDIGVIVFRNLRHRPIGALLNYSSHIHSYPTLNFTAELAGAVIRKMERRFPGLLAIYTNGAEGNVSLDQYLEPQKPNAEDWDRQYLKGLDLFSGRIMRGVNSACKGMSFAARVRMRCAETTVPLRAYERKNGRIPDRPSPLPQPLTALTIDDLALVGEQEEAFVELALGLKAASPFPKTFVVGFQGFRNKYFPTDHATEEGGYETSLRYHGDAMHKTITTAARMLGKLRQEAHS